MATGESLRIDVALKRRLLGRLLCDTDESAGRTFARRTDHTAPLASPEAAFASSMYGRADACYIIVMGTAPDSVKLDDDVHEELSKLAKRSGRPVGAVANDALRDFVRYENQVAAAIDRGISDLEAGRTRTTEEVLALLEQQRLARTRG